MLPGGPVRAVGAAGKTIPVKRASLQKPSKVERALEHLDKAVARLEAAIEGGARLASQGDGETAAPAGEIEALREENSRLRALNENVSDRLDGAIERLRAAIGEE